MGRAGRLLSDGTVGEIGFAGSVSTFGLAAISGAAWTGAGIFAVTFGSATRLILGLGLARVLELASNINSTPNSGFSSAGGSDAGLGADFGAGLAVGNSGFAMAFAFASGLRLPTNASFDTDFALGAGGISNNGDLGADLALAIGFLVTAGFGGSTGLTSGAGLLAAGFIFVARLRLSPGAGLAFAVVAVLATFATSGVFLMERFFGDFATFKAFARGLARLTLARREGGFLVVVFFDFFMATVLAMGGAFASGD